jgi:hypothetical protein
MGKQKKNSIVTQSISPTTSIRRSLSSNDLEDGFSTVVKNKKKKNQQTSSDQVSQVHQFMVTSVSSQDVPVAPVLDQSVTQLTSPIIQPAPVQPITVTNDSTRYALSRFPFPPFLIRFNVDNILPSHVKEELVSFGRQSHQLDIQILNCRLSRSSSNDHARDFLIYLKDAVSFSFLLDINHWPQLIKNQPFSLPSLPPIPPQLCLIIKNVDLNIDFDDFCADIKSRYPDVKNIIRMKNKFQNCIRMVKVELTSSLTRDKILNEKKIVVNYVYYSVSEYLAPLQVLICSKCSGIGHFRNTCTQIKSTCKTCCELIDNPEQHKCSNLIKCAHCSGNHKSTSSVCQVIKAYRADLTKKILQPIQNTSSTTYNLENFNPVLNLTNLPRQNVSQPSANTDMMKKLDDLINKISEVKDHLTSLTLQHEKFEKFIIDKNQNDEILIQNLNRVTQTTKSITEDVIFLRSKFVRHENIIERLMIPMFIELFQLFITQMSNVIDDTNYSNVKHKLDRYLKQMQQVRDGKHFL